MSRPAALSGFPEWLPAERIVEQSILDTVRRVFELHGFSSLETRAVEPLEQMLRKGEIDKEVYVLRRLHAEDDEGDNGLALHFDLTVPFARYVLQNAGHLDFPFRRYQIQKAWRGERPQEGRYREFTQADVDIVGRDVLAFHHEVEVALVMAEVFRALPCPPAVILVNNRKLAEGFFLGAGATDAGAALRAIDKLDKIGAAKVAQLLVAEAGLTADGARLCLALASIRSEDTSFVEAVRSLGVEHPLLDEGLAELAAVVGAAHARMPGALVADLKIARGLDYYTGTVYETQLVGYESFGSVCSGGRYDALASDGKSTYPGVGISLGVSRLMGVLVGRGLVTASRSVPTCVLVAVTDEATRSESEAVAQALRGRGINTEVAPKADKFGKQIRYADRRGIPFVWFLDTDEGHAVKDIRSGDQVPADPATWNPPPEDLAPLVRLSSPLNEEIHP
ncbi:MAG TPA: histidine--tRNA ligase [Candidatus Nanopelagicales bacterium]